MQISLNRSKIILLDFIKKLSHIVHHESVKEFPDYSTINAYVVFKLMREVCCSSTGKVLIVGGYLILEKGQRGLVLSVNARFYSSISSYPTNFESPKSTKIIPASLASPQFSTFTNFEIEIEENGRDSFNFKIEEGKIPSFVKNSLEIGLGFSYFFHLKNGTEKQFLDQLQSGISIVLQADNDFYSQQQMVYFLCHFSFFF